MATQSMFGASNPMVSTLTLTRYLILPALNSARTRSRSSVAVSPKTVATGSLAILRKTAATCSPWWMPVVNTRTECRPWVCSTISRQADSTSSSVSMRSSASPATNSPARTCRPEVSSGWAHPLVINGQR